MAKKSVRRPVSRPTLKTALYKERRANARLRSVIANLETAVTQNQRDLSLQFARIAQLQAEVDLLKRRPLAS